MSRYDKVFSVLLFLEVLLTSRRKSIARNVEYCVSIPGDESSHVFVGFCMKALYTLEVNNNVSKLACVLDCFRESLVRSIHSCRINTRGYS